MASSPKKLKAEESTITIPNWLDLPKDVTTKIFGKIGSQIEILKGAHRVCPIWRNISKDPLMWRNIQMCVRGTPLAVHKKALVEMCCYAIHLSSGQLEEIDVEVFGTDSLLQHIADSSSPVRRLRLAFCTGLSEYGVTNAVKKLPLLEELDVSYTNLSKKTLESIGQSCPHLKVLKFGSMRSIVFKGAKCDEEAYAIGKTMPNLLQLQLWGNNLNDAGLVAILDGCPNLESLDLRGCFNLYFGGNLPERMDAQIIDFLHPFVFLDYADDDNDPYADLYCDGGITQSSEDEAAAAYWEADYLGLL